MGCKLYVFHGFPFDDAMTFTEVAGLINPFFSSPLSFLSSLVLLSSGNLECFSPEIAKSVFSRFLCQNQQSSELSNALG